MIYAKIVISSARVLALKNSSGAYWAKKELFF